MGGYSSAWFGCLFVCLICLARSIIYWYPAWGIDSKRDSIYTVFPTWPLVRLNGTSSDQSRRLGTNRKWGICRTEATQPGNDRQSRNTKPTRQTCTTHKVGGAIVWDYRSLTGGLVSFFQSCHLPYSKMQNPHPLYQEESWNGTWNKIKLNRAL